MRPIGISLIVLRCRDIAVTRRFYEALGLVFQQEQHGKGPVHYSTVLTGGMVLELYPSASGAVDNTRLGLFFPVLDDVSAALRRDGVPLGKRQHFGSHEFVVAEDPDGRKIELVQQPAQRMAA